MNLFTITVGTAKGPCAQADYVGKATRVIRARNADAAMRTMSRFLKRRGLRPVGFATVEGS